MTKQSNIEFNQEVILNELKKVAALTSKNHLSSEFIELQKSQKHSTQSTYMRIDHLEQRLAEIQNLLDRIIKNQSAVNDLPTKTEYITHRNHVNKSINQLSDDVQNVAQSQSLQIKTANVIQKSIDAHVRKGIIPLVLFIGMTSFILIGDIIYDCLSSIWNLF